ncbi:hypothetical protein OG871_09795 [Kitasatospora sp. NBC_00374]|uniref:hypothetical protein n=1 Tax=Kitasatospora sp. NBC_00374 TaxID=2975964 RepID=UPI0030E04CDA
MPAGAQPCLGTVTTVTAPSPAGPPPATRRAGQERGGLYNRLGVAVDIQAPPPADVATGDAVIKALRTG